MGIEAVPVTVEVEISRGIGIHLSGLADVAVKESLLRTTTALQSLGFHIPGKRIVINLAPADMHKVGTGYDLPIAVGIIAASGQTALPEAEKYMIMGELGLDGSIRNVRGALPYAELARDTGLKGMILPYESALEAVELGGITIYGVRSFVDVTRILSGTAACDDLLVSKDSAGVLLQSPKTGEVPDFSEIIGQEGAKRAIEIAASGGHNVILVGSPASGKSSLAKAMSGILPPMTDEEALVTSKIYSIAGKGASRFGLIRTRPFRSPHYSTSIAALIGGGGGDGINPGEVSLAQNGVLFLDEIGQMSRSGIEALRGPLEDRKVTISRLRAKVEYPSSFMFMAASNPCPCGYWGEGDRCVCTPTQRQNYLSRLSGPIMDRIDIQAICRGVRPEEIRKGRASGKGAESSSAVALRVKAARKIQKERFRGEDIYTNAEMNNRLIEKYCPLSAECEQTMLKLMEKMGLSMRAYFRIIKVSRTIADLEGCADIMPHHLLEAAGYRFLDRNREVQENVHR